MPRDLHPRGVAARREGHGVGVGRARRHDGLLEELHRRPGLRVELGHHEVGIRGFDARAHDPVVARGVDRREGVREAVLRRAVRQRDLAAEGAGARPDARRGCAARRARRRDSRLQRRARRHEVGVDHDHRAARAGLLRGDGDGAGAVLRGEGERVRVVDGIGHRGSDDGRGVAERDGYVDRLPAELEPHGERRGRRRRERDDAARGGARSVGHGARVERRVGVLREHREGHAVQLRARAEERLRVGVRRDEHGRRHGRGARGHGERGRCAGDGCADHVAKQHERLGGAAAR